MTDDYEELLVRPKPLEEILEEGGVVSGGPSPWGHSFWGRALRCDYDGYLTRVEGFPSGTSQALVVGILVHACLALYMAALRAGQPLELAMFQLRRPIDVVLAWCRKVLTEGESRWAMSLYTWASEAGYLVGAYVTHWKVADLQGRTPTLNDLVNQELTNPALIEDIVETNDGGFPFTVRFDRVYYVTIPGLGLRAVAMDHKTVGEASDEWLAAYWQDPQLMGFFHTWNTTAEARGVPPMHAVVIDKIGKPQGPRGVPSFARYPFVIRQDRVALWQASMRIKAVEWLAKYHAASSPEHAPDAPWRYCPLNMTACFTKRYRPCERLDDCLMLGDTRVYTVGPLPAEAAPPPPPVVEPAVEPVAPAHDRTCVEIMLRLRGYLGAAQQDEACRTVTGRALAELTADDVKAMVGHLMTVPLAPAPAVSAAQPPAPPVADDDDWVEIEPDRDEEDYHAVLAELRSRSVGNAQRLEYLSWLESASDLDVRAHAVSVEQGDRILRYRDPLKVRLELARVLLEWLTADPNAPATMTAPPPPPLPPPVPPAAEVEPPAAAAVWPAAPHAFDPKAKYTVKTWHNKYLSTADAAPKGTWVYITGVIAMATGETDGGNVRFVTEGGLPLGCAPGTKALPVDVETEAESQERLKDEIARTAALKAEKAAEIAAKKDAQEQKKVKAARDADPAAAPEPIQVGQQACMTGIVPVLYYGTFERVPKGVQAAIGTRLKAPGYAIAMQGVAGKQKLKVWLSIEGSAISCTKSTLGSAVWDQLGRLALDAAGAAVSAAPGEEVAS